MQKRRTNRKRKRANNPSKQFDPSPTAASRKLTLTIKISPFLKKDRVEKKAPPLSSLTFLFFFLFRCKIFFPREYFSLDEREKPFPSVNYLDRERKFLSFNLPGQFAFSKRREATYLVFNLSLRDSLSLSLSLRDTCHAIAHYVGRNKSTQSEMVIARDVRESATRE